MPVRPHIDDERRIAGNAPRTHTEAMGFAMLDILLVFAAISLFTCLTVPRLFRANRFPTETMTLPAAPTPTRALSVSDERTSVEPATGAANPCEQPG